MGYLIRDQWGNVIGEQETEKERQDRENGNFGCLAIVLGALIGIGSWIQENIWIVIVLILIGVSIWLIIRAINKEDKVKVKAKQHKYRNTSSITHSTVEKTPVVPRQFKYANNSSKTLMIAKELQPTICHSWILDSIEIGDQYTIINMTTIPKTDNTYAYSEEDYIVDVKSGNRYKSITNTLGTKNKPKILRKPVPYSFKKVYPALPPDIDTISIWSDGKCIVDGLRITAIEQ